MTVTINGNGTVDGLSNLTSGDLTVDTNTLYVDAANNRVGIGTASPSRALHLSFTGSNGIRLQATDAGLPRIDFDDTAGSANIIGTANRLQIYTNNTERMRIDSSGNVGIGTSNPSAKLNVVSTNAGNNSVGLLLTNLSNTSGTGATIGFSPYNDNTTLTGSISNYNESSGSYSMRFNTWNSVNNAERMRIDSSGNVLVGATATFSTGDVNVGGTGGIYVATVVANEPTLTLKLAGGNGTVARFIRGGVSSPVGSIYITPSTTSYNTSSDYRLKENVAPMSGGIDRLKQLKPSTWSWTQDGSHGEGFLAHEAQIVVPEAVTGTKDEVDDKGNPVYQGIDQSKLVPLLTAALQEAITKIEDLETRIQTLENK